MALFKKTKKKSPQQKYCESLMEQITFASFNGKYAIYVAAEGVQEDWVYEFCSQRGYEVRASHTSENITYYKIWGWG